MVVSTAHFFTHFPAFHRDFQKKMKKKNKSSTNLRMIHRCRDNSLRFFFSQIVFRLNYRKTETGILNPDDD